MTKIAYSHHLSPNLHILPADRAIATTLSNIDQPSYDFQERTDNPRPLFARARKKVGDLALGECYGFFPAVGLGGAGVLDEVRKVRALKHFGIIAQLDTIQLRYNDLEKKRVVVLRDLGGSG